MRVLWSVLHRPRAQITGARVAEIHTDDRDAVALRALVRRGLTVECTWSFDQRACVFPRNTIAGGAVHDRFVIHIQISEFREHMTQL